ncbi:MAG: FHA domain-containing protein [Anaerolineae bacterium]
MATSQDTQSIPLNDPRFQAMLAALEDNEGTASLSEFNEVLLVIDGMIARIVIQDNQEYRLGRFKVTSHNELDLNPYGALHHGVSRIHAKIIMDQGKLFIVDLGSSNGTYVRRTRLHPYEPALLRQGDELLLGRMRIQVMFQ